MTEVPAQGIKRALCCVLAARGARVGQPCNRPLKDGRCRNHPNEEEAPAAPVMVAELEAELTVEAATEAEAAALAAAEASTEVDPPLLIVALRKATLAKTRAVVHDGLAAKSRAVLQQQVTIAMDAARQVALAELDLEGQTLTAERSKKTGQYMQAEYHYWAPFVFAK